MALSVKKGTLTTPTATGNQSYTGVGFQPKALVMWITNQTAEGIAAGARLGIGVCSPELGGFPPLDEAVVAWRADDNVSPTFTERVFADFAIDSLQPDVIAVLVSFDVDGFTLNWTVAGASGLIVHFLALGGADLTNAKANQFTANTATGNQGVTGVGFRPDVVLLLSAASFDAFVTIGGKLSLGAMQSTTKRWANALNARSAQTMTANVDAMSTQRTDSCFLSLTDTAAIDSRADFVSMDADGFTINWIDAPASAILIGYLALKGGSFDVGAVAACTVVNCNNDVPVGFTSKGLLLCSWGKVASTAIVADAEVYVGAGDGANEGTSGATENDAVLPTQADSSTVTTKVIRTLIEGATATVDGEADHDLAAVADGFRLTWTDPPAVAAEVCYVAFGDAPAVPGQPVALRRGHLAGAGHAPRLNTN